MGQKVNPTGFRIALNPGKNWHSRWFTTRPQKYIEYLLEDVKLRDALMDKLKLAGITQVDIERSLRALKVIVYVTRPGVVIGRGGSGLEELKKFIYQILKYRINDARVPKIELKVEEIKNPDTNAYLVATRIAEQLEKRMTSRRVVTKAIERSMQAGVTGIKVLLAGRVNGAEISRKELYPKGSIPLSTLRAEIDYAQVPALTRSGYVGVKVWIYKGEKE